MKTIRFHAPLPRNPPGNEEACWTIPPYEHRLFETQSDVCVVPHSVRALGRARGGVSAGGLVLSAAASETCALQVSHLLVGDLSNESDDLYVKHPVQQDGKIIGCRPINCIERIMIDVYNPFDFPVITRPVIVAGVALTADSNRPFAEDVIMSPHPMLDGVAAHKLCIGPGTTAHFDLLPPCYCHARKLTIRSDSKLDLLLTYMALSNVAVTTAGEAPVDFFRDGVAIRMPPWHPSFKLNVALTNVSSEPRWAEIDVGADPIATPTTAAPPSPLEARN